MKKALIILGIVAVVCGMLHAEGKVLITATGNLLLPADGAYKDIYGSSVFFPEFKLGYRLFGKGYVWLGYGFFSKEGETATLKLPTKSNQSLLSLGGGYTFDLSDKTGFNGELGLVNVSYKEEALDLEESGSALGFVISGSLNYKIANKVFLHVIFGYIYASDKIGEDKIKLGGFRSGIGVGITL